MAFDEGLAERVREALRGRTGISERRMFGGIAFMQHGHMFVGIAGESLMCRVGPAAYADALRERHVREMDFNGRPMKGYVFVAAEGLASDAALARWVDRGADFVRTLPPK